jgi:hypothetical protein
MVTIKYLYFNDLLPNDLEEKDNILEKHQEKPILKEPSKIGF